MNKTKCTKIVSLGIVMMLLLSVFSLTPVAESSLVDFVNPEFTITKEGEKEKIEGWSLYGNATMDNILTVNDENYQNNPYVDGNVFHSTTNGHGLITSDFLPLNSERSALISVWYKSSEKNAIRIIVEGYNDLSDDAVETSSPEYLPSTNGSWINHKYTFTSINNATKVKVIIRLVDYSEKLPVEQEDGSFKNEWIVTGPVKTADIYFMAPSYSTVIPVMYLSNPDFESNSTDGWSVTDNTNDAGEKEVAEDSTGNHYLKLTSDGTTDQYRVNSTSSANELLTFGGTYKISFKFIPISEGSTPRLDVYHMTTKGYQAEKSENAAIVSLGENVTNGWTEYIYYVTLQGTREDKDGNASRLKVQLRAKKGECVGYDDIKIEPAENLITIYQNGVETSTLTPGAVGVRYHNISATDETFIAALYKVDSKGCKTLDKIEVITANANMAVAGDDAVIDTITVPDDGASYLLKAFAWSDLEGLSPSVKAKTAKTGLTTPVE